MSLPSDEFRIGRFRIPYPRQGIRFAVGPARPVLQTGGLRGGPLATRFPTADLRRNQKTMPEQRVTAGSVCELMRNGKLAFSATAIERFLEQQLGRLRSPEHLSNRLELHGTFALGGCKKSSFAEFIPGVDRQCLPPPDAHAESSRPRQCRSRGSFRPSRPHGRPCEIRGEALY